MSLRDSGAAECGSSIYGEERKGGLGVLCALIGSSGFHLHRPLSLSRHRVQWCGWLRPKGDSVLCMLCAFVSAHICEDVCVCECEKNSDFI